MNQHRGFPLTCCELIRKSIYNLPVFAASEETVEAVMVCFLQKLSIATLLIGYQRMKIESGLSVQFDVNSMV